MFEGKEVKVLLASAGSGKGNWVECKIPTPEGIRRFGDIKAGDFVFNRFGKPIAVAKVYQRGFLDAYKVTLSDGRSTIVSLDHLWSVYKGTYSNKLQTLELRKILTQGLRGVDTRINRKFGQPRWYVPAHQARIYKAQNVPVDPYVFGAFTGNDCLTSDYLEFSSNDEETVNKVATRLGLTYSKRSKYNYTWDFKRNGQRVRTKEYFTKAYAGEKYIPDCYKYNTLFVRWELLRGLFDTDGSATKRGDKVRVSYSTTSKRLAKDVKEILNSVGLISSIREDKREGKNICYELNVNSSKKNKCQLFSLTRKVKICYSAKESKRHYDRIAIRSVEKLPEKLEINCIWVDDEEHLYQCDDGIVTHNTRRLIDEVSEELKTRRPEEIAFVTFTRKGAEEGLRRVCSKLVYEPEDLPYFRTLHSLTFHALNLKRNQMFGRLDQRKFNKEFGYNVNRCEVETGKVAPTKDSQYLDFYDMERSGALTSKQLVEADIEQGYYKQIVKHYEEYKAREQKVDFFDCLIKYVQNGETLPVKVAMIDECFSPETKVRMADLSVKVIKDIKVGDYVMGTKGATKVTAVHKGTDTMYDVVTGKKQKLFTCNSQHLILQKSNYSTMYTWKHCSEITRRARVFIQPCMSGKSEEFPVNPYFFGLWLGNGFSREAVVVCNENDTDTINWLKAYGESLGDKVTLRHRKGIIQVEYSVVKKGLALKCEIIKRLENMGFLLAKTKTNTDRTYKEKTIPDMFLQASEKDRLSLLAGIIDSDGIYVKAGNNFKYRIEMAREELMYKIRDLVASLGYFPSWYETYHTKDGVTRKYYRVDFFGSEDIPCLLKRKQFKRCPKSNELSCRIIERGEGEYVGITVEAEDHLFTLANGCSVHNCQDITALQWKVIEKAFSKAEKIIIAGDDKQCQPTGSLVLTKNGYKAIEDITSEDSLITFSLTDYAYYGKRQREYHPEIACRHYTGKLIDVNVDGTVNRFTPNHKLIVRWQNRDTSLQCVYLMRKEDWFRVGQCQLFTVTGNTHFTARMNLEEAEEGWILRICKTKEEALIWEQIYSMNYGIPQISWSKWHTAEMQKTVYDFIPYMEAKAEQLLKEVGRDIDYPMFNHEKANAKSGGTCFSLCEAINLIPEVMMLPIYQGKSKVNKEELWHNFTVTTEDYSGNVYSMNVPKHHTYITDGGLTVHNCIYAYSGARPDFLIQLSKKFPVEYLNKSYRIPYSVYKLASAITDFIGEKTDLKAEPRLENGEGKIMQLNDIGRITNFIDEDCIKNDTEHTAWYILARNNCFLEEPKKALEDKLIPYWTAEGFFMDGEIMKRLKDYEGFSMEGYRDSKKKEDFQRKFGIEDFSKPFTDTNLFTEGRKWVYASYIEKYGLKKLEEMCKWNPQVLVSTIHHVKGGECENCAIMLDTTRKTKGNVFENIDEELRILYVGVTRTKENLFLIDSKNGDGYDNILATIKEQFKLEW